ncbi:MAG: CbtB domain-containing protein [Nitrososphaeraceae archaeon]
MTISRQIQVQDSGIPKLAIGILAMILLFGLFIVGYDQGQVFSIVQGEKAFEDLYVHELFHDMRHAAGFPCH